MTGEEMIEVAARAICLAQLGDAEIHGEARCCQAGGLDGCCLKDMLPAAKAALEAVGVLKS